MSDELIIDVGDVETRVALRKRGVLHELHVERSGRHSLAGNVYVGRVDRVVPGMQAAFVDVGLPRFGFLHARDALGGRATEGEDAPPPEIQALVRSGQRVLVQVAKDSIGAKGPRLTMGLALASRSLVMLPYGGHIGVSQRIEDETERERLRNEIAVAAAAVGTAAAFIARTVAEGAATEQLCADMRVLLRIWQSVEERCRRGAPGDLVYEELPVHTRAMRDLASWELSRVLVNDAETHARLRRYAGAHLPDLADRVRHYDQAMPLFDRYGIEDELQRALHKKVSLKSGGYLVIEQTEAMTTIDVNTGAWLGARNLEETALRTNVEAANVIPRQLRLRNIGGIVVIDFIDMDEEANRRTVMRALEKGVEEDPAKVRLTPFSPLGLVELSRKRTRPSLAQVLCEPCQACAGGGMAKRPETTCGEILRFIRADAQAHAADAGEYCVYAHERVIERLLDEDAGHLDGVSREIGRPIRLRVEPSCAPGEFDAMLVGTAALSRS